jgi:adenine-specific DNA-methyltransferase
MGTKRELAPKVASVVSQARSGLLLDAFSGMCCVGEAVGTKRQVWTNDALAFPASVGRALFTSRDEPPRVPFIVPTIFPRYEDRLTRLSPHFSRSLALEAELLDAESYAKFASLHRQLANALIAEAKSVVGLRSAFFVRNYSNKYFGVSQAVAIDALIGVLKDTSLHSVLSDEQRLWCLLALGRATLRISNSTGHFAQYLTPNERTYKRYVRQRRRNLWEEWIYSTGELAPVGDIAWRRHNRSFNEDSLKLIPRLGRMKDRPSVIYADPPYTNDQYSRFYHILDTIILYDDPPLSGRGLYRAGRFSTSFSIKSRVVETFDSFLRAVASLNSDLVLSYPTNGLLYDAGTRPMDLLKKHFRRVERCYSARHRHSTFGASKGAVKAAVTEVIYLARP